MSGPVFGTEPVPQPATPPPVAPTPPAVSVTAMTKRYGLGVALDAVTLEVPTASVCGLIGPNGAGKSTLMSIVATLLRPSAGTGHVFGVPLTDVRAVRRCVGYVPDVLGTYSGLTVEEYLLFFADAYRIEPDRRRPLVDGLLELVDLDTKRDAEVNTLSRGMKQRIGLARGLVHDPRLLILDEPASGLDPRARIDLRDIISHLQAMGVTILISSHILGELEEMCTHAAVLEQGRLVGFESLAADPVRTVVVTFLGGASESFSVVSDEEQATLVQRLVHEGRGVVSVNVLATRLEDRFMRLTEGRTN
jgi:ABC-2 type transport system ATP-binding protein